MEGKVEKKEGGKLLCPSVYSNMLPVVQFRTNNVHRHSVLCTASVYHASIIECTLRQWWSRQMKRLSVNQFIINSLPILHFNIEAPLHYTRTFSNTTLQYTLQTKICALQCNQESQNHTIWAQESPAARILVCIWAKASHFQGVMCLTLPNRDEVNEKLKLDFGIAVISYLIINNPKISSAKVFMAES